jgi:hypothetical protein
VTVKLSEALYAPCTYVETLSELLLLYASKKNGRFTGTLDDKLKGEQKRTTDLSLVVIMLLLSSRALSAPFSSSQ